MLFTNETRHNHPILSKFSNEFWQLAFKGQFEDNLYSGAYQSIEEVKIEEVENEDLSKMFRDAAIQLMGKFPLVSPEQIIQKLDGIPLVMMPPEMEIFSLYILMGEQDVLEKWLIQPPEFIAYIFDNSEAAIGWKRYMIDYLINSGRPEFIKWMIEHYYTELKNTPDPLPYFGSFSKVSLELYVWLMNYMNVDVGRLSNSFLEVISRHPSDIDSVDNRYGIIEKFKSLLSTEDANAKNLEVLMILCHLDRFGSELEQLQFSDRLYNYIKSESMASLHNDALWAQIIGSDFITVVGKEFIGTFAGKLITSLDTLAQHDVHRSKLFNPDLINKLIEIYNNNDVPKLIRRRIQHLLHQFTKPCIGVSADQISTAFINEAQLNDFKNAYQSFNQFQFFNVLVKDKLAVPKQITEIIGSYYVDLGIM